jgi:predicted metallo-beta-lactamase superfamily hydrolase
MLSWNGTRPRRLGHALMPSIFDKQSQVVTSADTSGPREVILSEYLTA